MKRLLVAVVALGILVSILEPSPASSSQSVSVEHEPELVVSSVAAVDISAVAYSVIDIETGQMLLSHNADQNLPIASVTKLFTAAALDAIPRNEEVIITAADVATEGRAGKLEVGQSYSARELLFPLLLESSNDAATALERNIGQVTLAGQTLADASGLSALNRASATVVASEMRSVYLTHPHVFDVTKLKQYVGKYTGWVNNSPVRDLPGYQGGKHGYTEASGKTLAAVFSEESLNERRLGYVILGSKDIKADTIALRSAVASSVHLE
jgi:D-alanyl-D-alanine carboxypeptidase